MRKRFTIGCIIALATLAIAGTASGQKAHAPKGIWQGMIAYLSEVNDITASLMVFDMGRIATRAGDIAGRGRYMASIDSLPDVEKEGHTKVAEAADALAAAAETGEEQEVAARLADVISACSSCHYDVRDKERREKRE